MGGQSRTYKTCFIQQRATGQTEASRHPTPTSTQESDGTHAGDTGCLEVVHRRRGRHRLMEDKGSGSSPHCFINTQSYKRGICQKVIY